MATSLVILRCIGKAVLKAAVKVVPFGEVVLELATDAYGAWSQERDEAQRRAELQALAQATASEIKTQISAIVQEIAGNQPGPVRQTVEAYLVQVPVAVHQSFRRVSDPSGRTAPSLLSLRKADDLVPFLPTQLPRFKPGDRPLPGIDWELVELLGTGGFGEVWKARNPHFENMPPVALKFCLDQTAKDRLLRHEAAVLNQVMRQGRHPGIVTLQHTYLSADPACLEYEYVEGGDLAGLIKDAGRRQRGLPPARAAQVVLRLAKAVGHAHRLEPPVVHRDLKPANILVQRTADNKVHFKIADFGIGGVAASQAIEQASRPGTGASQFLSTAVRGSYTPLYASPQQVRGAAPDPRDDVYSLGVIWHQLLTGDPTAGRPGGGRWKLKLAEQGVPPQMAELLEACFEDDPADRPADARVLEERLATVLAPARPPVPPIPERAGTGERPPHAVAPPISPHATTGPVPGAAGTPKPPPVDAASVGGGEPAMSPPGERAAETSGVRSGRPSSCNAVGVNPLLPAGEEQVPRTPAQPCPRVSPDRAQAASAQVQKGEEERGAGRVEQAIAAFTEAIHLDPTLALAYAHRANAYNDAGEYDKSVTDNTKAICLDPKIAVAYGNRRIAFSQLGEHDRAVADCGEAIRLAPEEAWFYAARGEVYLVKGDYELAIRDLTEAIRRNASFADAYLNRGGAYHKKGDCERAVADFTEAIRLDPGSVYAYFMRGLAQAELRRYARAIADFTKAIRLDPESWQAFVARGDAYGTKGDERSALKDYTKAIRLASEKPGNHVSRGWSYFFMGKYDKAVEDFTRAIQLDPELAAAHHARGCAYREKGDYDSAVADGSEAIRFDPEAAEHHYSRGATYRRRGDADLAITDCCEAIRREPQFVLAYYERGAAYAAKGQPERASNPSSLSALSKKER
jgi:tetratricopeptide (TPR) repeat protein